MLTCSLVIDLSYSLTLYATNYATNSSIYHSVSCPKVSQWAISNAGDQFYKPNGICHDSRLGCLPAGDHSVLNLELGSHVTHAGIMEVTSIMCTALHETSNVGKY